MKAPFSSSDLAEWSRRFGSGEMSVEQVQDAFASLTDEAMHALAPELRRELVCARQELDAIRYGMCESGQAGEITRIFLRLDRLLRRAP